LGAIDLDIRVLEADDLHFILQQKAIPFPWPCPFAAFLLVGTPARLNEGAAGHQQHGVE
jgi:hypothetical protein